MGTEFSLPLVDLQHLIAIKLCWAAFVAVGLVCIFTRQHRAKPWFFLAATGMLFAVSYATLMDNLHLLLWGLQGDEITIAAMFNTFAHQSLWSDFAYHNLPPFYPPLFFWLFGLWGRLLNWNGIVIAKSAAAVTLALSPLLFYGLMRAYWRRQPQTDNTPGAEAILLTPLILFIVNDQAAIIGKPYEFIAAALTVLWTVFLYQEVFKTWRWQKSLWFGVTAGLLFMTYYLWLVFAALAFALMGLGVPKIWQWRYYGRLLIVGVVALLTSLPYLGPLILSAFQYGTENWQAALFTPADLAVRLPMFEGLGFRNLILLGGLVVLIVYRRNEEVKPLLGLFLATYFWWAIGAVTVLLAGVPFQLFRGFYFLMPSVLGMAAAYGLERVWRHTQRLSPDWRSPLLSLGVLFISTQFIFGFFADDPLIQARRRDSKELRSTLRSLVTYLVAETPSTSRPLTLHTVPEIAAFVPINSFLYFNQHNSNPAANFSARFEYVKIFASAQRAKDFYEQVSTTPWGRIDRLIVSREGENYRLYFHIDELGRGFREEQVDIAASLISPDYFDKVYDNKGLVVWETRPQAVSSQ